MGSDVGFLEPAKRRVENLPGRNLPNLVGKANGFADLPIAEASLPRFWNMILHAGHTVAPHCGAKRHQFPFDSA